jgi:hypothetical protein
MLFVLASCNASTTKTSVRVVGLSFEGEIQPQNTNQRKSVQKLLNNNTLTNVSKEYIFHGDILIFTIEIEDPNFEFISLLSVEFNDKIIRANVNDSIVKTSDCGLNICVNFPFEIDEKVSEYTVQSVKFAKLNNDSGVDAIIDNQSVTTKVLDIYNQEIYPYVLESVKTLNDAILIMNFYEYNSHSPEDFETIRALNRQFSIINFSREVASFEKLIDFREINFYSFNSSFNEDYDVIKSELDEEIITKEEYDQKYEELLDRYKNPVSQYLYIYRLNPKDCFGCGPDGSYYFEFSLFENKYKDAFFYNVGNSIFIDILGEEYFIIEIEKDMKIVLGWVF